jgi:CMP/dCMP kinase
VPKPLLITIDGPAGAGKTTVGRLLAKHLRYRYLDTGALYRAIAYSTMCAKIDITDTSTLESHLGSMALTPIPDHHGFRLICNGLDITDKIRTPEISMAASAVSAKLSVRAFLLGMQRRMGENKAMVCEGRDMGTVVFPEADIKFYLDADPLERAQRRLRELPEGSKKKLEDISREMIQRDRNDSSRDIAPLKPADDAVRIDCTRMPLTLVIDHMMTFITPLLN